MTKFAKKCENDNDFTKALGEDMARKSPSDPIARLNAIVSLAAQIKIADTIEETCRNADADARKRYRKELVRRARGQTRYFDLENDFSRLGETFPALSVQLELHLGGGASFAVIERPDLRLTLARLQKYDDNPFARPFRRGKLTQEASRRFRSGQTSFFPEDPPNEKRLVATVCFGFTSSSDAVVPSYIEVRFADKNYQCMNEYVDLQALQRESRRVPVEEVPDSRETTSRVPSEEVPEERRTQRRFTADTMRSTDADS